MKVLFLQAVHTKTDDRVAYHQRVSLEQSGVLCYYASIYDNITESPDVVICDYPIAIKRARQLFCRHIPIIYDITEWYPSKKNLRYEPLWFRPLKFCILVLVNLWAGCAATAFIFGEYHKAKPFRFFFPWKRSLLLPYYPSLQYIHPTAPRKLTNEVHLFYAGPKTKEKGFERVQRVVQLCKELLTDKLIKLTAIENVAFNDFCETITKQDFFLDLRDDDIENTHCLPIKLFYYMAAGRPVIYSDLKAIRHGLPEIVEDSLVRPDDITRAAKLICQYVAHPELYEQICYRNKQLIENKYNWELQSKSFVQFIENVV